MGKGMSKILPGLYVGNFSDSTDSEQLTKYKVTHILSACNLPAPQASRSMPGLKRLVLDIEDKPSQNISKCFNESIQFIHKARAEDGVVLVHCIAGVSRSVTIASAYLLTISDLTWRQAISCVRACRPIANPNLGFQKQLQDWCETERWKSVSLIKQFHAVPFNDRQTLNHLLEKHERWVETGKYEDDLYPLAPGAYKFQSSGPGESKDFEFTSSSVPSRGERQREAMREAVRSRILSERRHEAKMAELDAREGQLIGASNSSSVSELTEENGSKMFEHRLHVNSATNITSSNSTVEQFYKDSPLPTSKSGTRASYSDPRNASSHWTSGNIAIDQRTQSTTIAESSNYQYVQSSDQLSNI